MLHAFLNIWHKFCKISFLKMWWKFIGDKSGSHSGQKIICFCFRGVFLLRNKNLCLSTVCTFGNPIGHCAFLAYIHIQCILYIDMSCLSGCCYQMLGEGWLVSQLENVLLHQGSRLFATSNIFGERYCISRAFELVKTPSTDLEKHWAAPGED